MPKSLPVPDPTVYTEFCSYHPNCPGHALKFDLVAEPSLTKQSFAVECDINNIIERARNNNGVLLNSDLNTRLAQYGDFTNIPDYQSSLNIVNNANALFMALDASLRERFSNDPSKFLFFMQDPSNRDEMVKLGLIPAAAPAKEPPQPPKAEPAAPAAGPAV